MPRAKVNRNANGLPSPDDLAELQAALAGTLSKTRVEAFPTDDWAILSLECIRRGYTLVISPQMDGRAVRLSVPVGTQKLAIVASTDAELHEGVRALILTVRKLPSK